MFYPTNIDSSDVTSNDHPLYIIDPDPDLDLDLEIKYMSKDLAVFGRLIRTKFTVR
jgi:hypothetical protein